MHDCVGFLQIRSQMCTHKKITLLYSECSVYTVRYVVPFTQQYKSYTSTVGKYVSIKIMLRHTLLTNTHG